MDCQFRCAIGSKIDRSGAANTRLHLIRGRLTRPRGLPRRPQGRRFRRTHILKTQSTRTRLLASSVICGAAVLASGQAFAQDNGSNVEEFVVTGSRIPQPNLTSTSPITVVGDQEAKLQGTTNVESLINNLPQAFADFTSGVSNGASGTATVDLRGLGSQRT